MLTVADIKKAVETFAPRYGIKKATLFGSRATKNFLENSDVDLIVEFETRAVSLFTLAGLMNDLEEIFRVSVDIIHGPPGKDCMLEIDKEIEIYAAQGTKDVYETVTKDFPEMKLQIEKILE